MRVRTEDHDHAEKPLFGLMSEKRMNTHWVAFIKQDQQSQNQDFVRA